MVSSDRMDDVRLSYGRCKVAYATGVSQTQFRGLSIMVTRQKRQEAVVSIYRGFDDLYTPTTSIRRCGTFG